MTDATPATSHSEVPQLLELLEILKKSGISNESASYIVGKFAREVTDKLSAEIVQASQDEQSLRSITDTVQLAGEMQKVFEKKMKTTVDARRIQIAQAVLDDFKAAGPPQK